MLATLKGEIAIIRPDGIVLENLGVGYLVYTPNPYSYKIGDDVYFHIHHYFRDDINALYGFKDEKSRDLFIKLIGVSGIGPKSAMSIMASHQIDDVIDAIETSNVKYLTKFPGIGTKSAQQIILDLKGKLIEVSDNELFPVDNDAELALMSLGYNKKNIKKALQKVDLTLPVEEVIKEAFKYLLK